MKSKGIIILLLIICIVLGVALVFSYKNFEKYEKTAESVIAELSNRWVQVLSEKNLLIMTNNILSTNVQLLTSEFTDLSNRYVRVAAELANMKAEHEVFVKNATAEAQQKDKKISELQGEKDELTKRMEDLTASIENLEKQISDVQQKLAAAEGDKEFLLKELKRLQAEKAELERQLTSLTFLREQIRKLREELSVSRRLDWIRRGIYDLRDKKIGERLQSGSKTPKTGTNYPLNVEIKREGGATIITNTPPAK